MKGYLGKPAASGGAEQPVTLTGDSLTDLRRDSTEGRGGEGGQTNKAMRGFEQGTAKTVYR